MIKNKKILVTGGAGTVGSNIVKKLVERQADVTVIDNLDAYACYKKEVRPGDHPRSLDSLKTLAKFRGNSVGRPYAEAFVVIRHISND